ncbi:hypothetical protein N8H22_10470 [Stutzerimonas stutzeri]|uniref:hypothetical protein n=1 Tax=Stutzerimonas sp. S1 TaxID=3030652 RepID=UPI002224EC24|nr:hypothetical protein [Stutzerimonas sp. S1]MCW3149016.1 hypothetical protein [Stutzerimonas sp. S1]
MTDSATLLLTLLLGHVAVDFLLPLRQRVRMGAAAWRSPPLYALALGQGLMVLAIFGVLRSDLALACSAALTLALARLLTAAWAASHARRSAATLLLEHAVQSLLILAFWLSGEHLWPLLPDYLQAQASPRHLSILLAYLVVFRPASALIGALLKPWQERIGTDDSLVNGGAFVGYLERGLILTFVLLGQWQAIGFLLTAKSILRFNELKGRNNRQRSEYVLLGTLLSFSLSIALGLAVDLTQST